MKVTRCFLIGWMLLAWPAAAEQALRFDMREGRVEIFAGDARIATYVWQDAAIPRPFFCNVAPPDGTAITRNHPPDAVADQGNDDHASYHPGIWMAFGDLGAEDFWRLKARVRHEGFVSAPSSAGSTGGFSVRNVYETMDEPVQPIATETCEYTFTLDDDGGYFLTLESIFHAARPGVAFGDQEEMGLGIRLATGLTVKHGEGTITNSDGGRNEAGTWGKASPWCAASGLSDGHRAGAMLMGHPQNFRPSWFHNRDYGLMVANAFGRKSMTGPDDNDVAPDSTALREGFPLRLQYGLYMFSRSDGNEPDYGKIYVEYVAKR